MATRVDQGHPQAVPAMDWPTAKEWRERQRQLPTALRVLRDSWEAEDVENAKRSAEAEAARLEGVRMAAIQQAHDYLRNFQGEAGTAMLIAPHTTPTIVRGSDLSVTLKWDELPGTHPMRLMVEFRGEQIVVSRWIVCHPMGTKEFGPGLLLAALAYAWKYAPTPF